MPVEIRELIIKTQVSANDMHRQAEINEKDVQQLKQQLLAECKKMITERTKKSTNTR
jgi:predicted ATP-grasp superfamily ATP-dependent carboligase